MIQEILVITSVAAAAYFLISYVRRQYFSDKKGCEGCSLSQLHSAGLRKK